MEIKGGIPLMINQIRNNYEILLANKSIKAITITASVANFMLFM